MAEHEESSLQVVREQVASAAADVERAATDLVAALTGRERELATELLQPARRLLHDVARVADLTLDPFAEFAKNQRELADQMAAWARMQHQLADHMLTWATAQRELAAAFELWMSPASGAARATTKALHKVAGDAADGAR